MHSGKLMPIVLPYQYVGQLIPTINKFCICLPHRITLPFSDTTKSTKEVAVPVKDSGQEKFGLVKRVGCGQRLP